MAYDRLDPLPIATPRTWLRRLSLADLADFQAYRTDPEVGRWQGWTATGEPAARLYLTQNAACALFVPGDWFQVGIALRSPDGRGPLIGDIGLCVDADDPACGHIGFSLNRQWQGRGLATEAVAAARTLAFGPGGLQRLTAVTDTRNLASVQLLRRLGFRLEHTAAAVFRGEACQEHHFVAEAP